IDQMSLPSSSIFVKVAIFDCILSQDHYIYNQIEAFVVDLRKNGYKVQKIAKPYLKLVRPGKQ
ncbi:MAG: hypothetical protein AAGK05_11435, partial [Pseudomonadota bacterium]